MTPFHFKPFEEMQPEDYAAVGFKSGLEIHQQLYTEKKLFCRCPAGRYSPKFDAEILRHMRPTLSELGEYDGTALMEFKTRKEIIYRIKRETVCTYEMDDTPPFMIDEEALDIALEVGLLYDCKMIDELHIARKQ
ncbi:Glu-tRNA(Gln) amidotransferase GatDE subunit E, partial [candidate division KSB1 bacterium]|nr:Glu-tRNA(Gln) amidotransferase GatDE subunit E [candidate division KSB1 bacterium]